MKFEAKAVRGAVKIKFIKGSLNRFDGKILSVGHGEERRLSRRRFVLQMRKVVSLAKQNKIRSIAVDFKDIKALAPKDFTDHETGKITAVAFVMAAYTHDTYKTKTKDAYTSVEAAAITGMPEDAKDGVAVGGQIGAAVNAARELANTPGGDMTPTVLARAAKAAAKTAGAGPKIKVTVLGRKEMAKLGMGAVLGVAKGSAEEPQFIVMEYWGATQPRARSRGSSPSTSSGSKPVVLIGKGVTFDTGGLNLKPGDHMYEMHMDMSGGATVIHAVALAAKLKLKANVIGLVPAVENSPGQNALRPGDILKSLSGKTIEVLNTDAEGRVILADAITYAKRFNPAFVVDVATLTGPSVFGQQASSIMTNRDELIPVINDLGEASGDYVWALPLWEEFDYIVKGKFGDVPNIPAEGNSRWAGVIAGGKFLEVFAKELGCPWVHIDMGSRMTSAPNEFLAKGAAGAPVRLLLAIIENHAHRPAR